MRPINRYLVDNHITQAANPCVSPDACLDWPRLRGRISAGQVTEISASRCATAHGALLLLRDADGDTAWWSAGALPLDDGLAARGGHAYPATWENLLRIKNLVQEHDPASTIFPRVGGGLERSSLGVGARFTALHWPGVAWAMAQLGLSVNANQNSIPRELVFDVDAMLAGTLGRVPFPFIGTSVPEGHQGQSVEGMSQGAVLAYLATGFHQRRVPWGFNADHQPVGGAFADRAERLVAGSLLATSITYDCSHVINAATPVADPVAFCAAQFGAARLAALRARVLGCGQPVEGLEAAVARWLPAISATVERDRACVAARERAFTTAIGRAFVRELSIDELPGLTTPADLAVILGLCEILALPVHFVAPAFGFAKNLPFADQAELERRVSAAWEVCRRFGVSIGFHSGSGKSEANYRLLGRITGGNLEIKTSGRYTYEMGRALAASSDAGDQQLWRDWYAFARCLAANSAFADDATERNAARGYILASLPAGSDAATVFASPAALDAALDRLSPDAEQPLWFEYNFLYVLAAGGRADKAALGDHGPAGYAQRARFYAISPAARLHYWRNVAAYIVFLAETTGQTSPALAAAARARLAACPSADAFLAEIAG